MPLGSKPGTENKIAFNRKTAPALPDPDEGQRLIRAFVKIRDRATREEIIRFVERAASPH